MATSLSLRSLLDNDKLVGSNFSSWYQKLKIVLEHERILYVITDPVPEEPAANAHGIVRDTYSQAECFFCKKWGHWKRNCPQYIASLDSNRQRKKQAIAGQGGPGNFAARGTSRTPSMVYFRAFQKCEFSPTASNSNPSPTSFWVGVDFSVQC
ncbi:uncharacterized protein [Elaeis guineensis]|uniref:uncharacterized protein n=1 Tax=Elaeis guineensis var. tenera TaxID=51953 RepID=UPI003C6D6D82